MTIITGLGLLLLTLAAFSLFSMKAPKGSAAMSGMANAAVATFLVEAVHRYISGDLLHLAFLGETGTISGNMGGVAAAIMVPIGMGVNPVFAVVAGVALGLSLIHISEPTRPGGSPDCADCQIHRLPGGSGCECGSGTHRRNDYGSYRAVAYSYGTSAGRGHQDDLYVAPQLHGPHRHAGAYGTAHGHCGHCMLRRLLYQRRHL